MIFVAGLYDFAEAQLVPSVEIDFERFSHVSFPVGCSRLVATIETLH